MNHVLTRNNETLLVTMTGKLTFSDNAAFKAILDDMSKGGVKDCVFDLSGLEFVDSTGLGMLVLAHDTAGENGFTVRLRNPRGHVRALLDRAEFSSIMAIE